MGKYKEQKTYGKEEIIMDDIELFKEFHVYGKRNIDHELLAYLSELDKLENYNMGKYKVVI